jgi:hypothetical protein
MSQSLSIENVVELGNRLSLPPRSQLYCLEPVGLGTGMVECLTSYIARLAAAHSLTPSSLVRRIIAPLARTSTLGGIGGKCDVLAQASPCINGNGGTSLECVRILRLLTLCESLEKLTFQFTAGWLAVRPLVASWQKWCARCLEERRNAGITLYYPLFWQVEHLHVCDRHEIELESECPHCAKRHRPLCRNLVIGYCPHCNGWLGASRVTLASPGRDPVRHAQLFVAHQIEQLIAASDQCPYGQSAVWPKNVQHLVRQHSDGVVHAFAKALGVHHSTVASWTVCKRVPTLTSVLMIAYASDLDLVDLVSNELTAEVSMRRALKEVGLGQMFRRPLRKHDVGLLREVMTKAAESPEFRPLSVGQVCRQVGCHQTYAARKFPILAEQIKAHRATYVQIHKQQRQFFTGLITKSVASQLAGSGKYPSNRRMRRALPSWISLRDPVARKAWLEVLEEWGWKGGQNESVN